MRIYLIHLTGSDVRTLNKVIRQLESSSGEGAVSVKMDKEIIVKIVGVELSPRTTAPSTKNRSISRKT